MGFLSSLFGIGGGSSKPATQQVVQTSKIPEEVAPFAKDVLERAQAEFQRRTAEGYVPYEGATIAPFTAQEEAAQEGIQALVGTSRPLQEEALALTRQQQQQFTPEVAEQFMSPYQRAVTDIEKREAQRTFERDIMPQLEAQAVGAGGMSGLGTRAALQASEAQRNQAQLLADIEARGLQSAFQDARQSFEQQKSRERAQAADVFAAGPAMFASGLKEQGALQTVGEQRRDLAQSALDEEYFKFLEEQAFPQERLAEYSGFVYGNPLLQQRTRTTTGTMQQAQPSLGRQLLGLAGTAAGIYGMGGGSAFGGPGFSRTNLYKSGFFGGTPAKTGGGLSALVKRQSSGQIGMSEETELTPEEIAFMRSRGVPAKVAAIAEDLKARREEAEALETRRREAEAGVGDVAVTPSLETEEIANQQARQQQLQDILRMREESEGGIGDAPVTPSLETEEEARRQRRAADLQDLLKIRQEAEAGVGDAPVTPSLETEQLARQQVRQSDLQNLLKMRQQAEAGAGASDVGQTMNPALQRELAAKDREMARRRQLAKITQGVTGVDVGRQAVSLAEDAGRGISSLARDVEGAAQKTFDASEKALAGLPAAAKEAIAGASPEVKSAINYVKNIPLVRDFMIGTEKLAEGDIPDFAKRIYEGFVIAGSPIYDAAGDIITYTTGIQTPTAEDVTGIAPFSGTDIANALKLISGKTSTEATAKDKPKALQPKETKASEAQQAPPSSKPSPQVVREELDFVGTMGVDDNEEELVAKYTKKTNKDGNDSLKGIGKLLGTGDLSLRINQLGDEDKEIMKRFNDRKALYEQLAKAQEQDSKSQIARANRANEINFWQGIVNIGGRLASTDDNWVGILSDETSKFMQRRKQLDAEITNKTGAAKVAALKTRADLATKDLAFLDSLKKTNTARIKALTEWLKANGASTKGLETRAKNILTALQKFAEEDYTKGGRRKIFEDGIMLAAAFAANNPNATSERIIAATIDRLKKDPKYKALAYRGSGGSGNQSPDNMDKAADKAKQRLKSNTQNFPNSKN
jgi:hypothetical protein